LRQLRRKAKAISGKRSLADYGIVRRIHFIYDRATRKFKGDVTIWMSWLQFCKQSNSKRQVSKVVTKALKLHPAASHFWAYAAAWYAFEHATNVAACARCCATPPSHAA
jgi:U3 small nucleolar RNA-associated protein 6